MSVPRPIVGITMGDPAGIGPEIILKALCRPQIYSLCRPLVFGTARFLKNSHLYNTANLVCQPIENPSEASFRKGTICIVELHASARIRIGKGSAASGKAALAYLDRAIESALRGEIDALVTAPLSKAAIRRAGGSSFVGHTEYLADKTDNPAVAMMFHSKRLNVALVTTHIPLRSVAAAISARKIVSVIRLSHVALEKLGIARPRIAVAGLNPHAGEEKNFGEEDANVIAPAVRAARNGGIDVQGPLPADALFHAAYHGKHDLVVAMYHDQALAPFKMIAFDSGVNITLGLPFVRTSVDHGTAFDIAGRGTASEQSLIEALKVAVRLIAK